MCWAVGLLGRVLQGRAPGLAWSVASLAAPTSRPQVSTLTSSGLFNGERVTGFSAAWGEDWKERGAPVRGLGLVRVSWLLGVGGLEVPLWRPEGGHPARRTGELGPSLGGLGGADQADGAPWRALGRRDS